MSPEQLAELAGGHAMAATHVGPVARGRHRGVRGREGRPAGVGALQRRLGQDTADRSAGANTARPVLSHYGGELFRQVPRGLASADPC